MTGPPTGNYLARGVVVQPVSRGSNMEVEDINVWRLLFQQTPEALRWAMAGAIVAGVSLIAFIWRWQRDEHRRQQEYIHQRIDREVNLIGNRLDSIDRHLIEIYKIIQDSNRQNGDH